MLKAPLLAKRIHLSHHALLRARQRARLFLFSNELENLEEFLKEEFRHSYINQKYECVPFYKTQLEIKHGKGSFISHSKLFKFMGNYNSDNGVVSIRTIAYINN